MSPPTSSQNSEKNPWWIDLLQKQGLPTLLVIVAGYYSLFSLAPYVGHKLDDLINWHMQNFNKVSSSLEEQIKMSGEQNEAYTRLAKAHEEQTPVLMEINAGIKKLVQDSEKTTGSPPPPK